MKKKIISTIFLRLKKNIPNPEIELKFSSNFELLIAVLLSAKSKDVQVNKITKKLFNQANNPKKMLRLGKQKIMDCIRSIGLYKKKTEYIIRACQILIKNFRGNIPNNRSDLESLPGIGRKSANVILNVAFHQNTIGVDTHVFRVSNRLGLSKSNNLRFIENQLISNIPKKFVLNSHMWLVLHGKYTCKSKNPLCKSCILNDLCLYHQNDIF
ncbi:DNA glycosylase and apyrimidinic (AP) lyase (endonuclease III) [Wigglesworthia glossinidia endosymbiont of Glossina morsitans morsitans (Yale colony)]|uniref:Endonuclease III n=1 Tax=Wigglesworthia glossinidia endosymbiont of Glossina morsitans morsitans (Yale colony) TaxID=1142511 RepID=H6Q4X6_WIGGL|nr:endonuclease III [Wigglesworthia glossinidia]AFA41259.1 DNA glycosylase and apyrimidinic (AP) lyase (endonuclease III) [Wigglesworthia glossinidia endosymbiont of Glossina morsitans morsitans (Yale colony)]